jgi:hypothetical protein
VLNVHGRIRADFEWSIISKLSAVHISASEVKLPRPGGFGIAVLTAWQYELNPAADVWVSNVSPRDGGVTFILHVDWHEPLLVAITITVEDRLPEEEIFTLAS